MKGKYTVKISNHRVSYTMELERNITILTGESGIGKTAMIRLVQNYEDAGKQSGVNIACKVPCRTINSDNDWENRLKTIHNSIIFIDEGRRFLKSQAFASAVEGNDNYFVLITRESLPQLSYSVRSILTLRNTTQRGSKHYARAYERFDFVNRFSDVINTADILMTEDSNAGFEAFQKLTEKAECVCVSAHGKSNIAGLMLDHQEQRIIVVADGAAFGAEMNNVYSYYQDRPNDVTLYLPESFEWLILRSGIVSGKKLKSILQRPWNYIPSEEYKSWEVYFTELLRSLTAGSELQYSKLKLAKAYLLPGNIEKLRAAIQTTEEQEKP